MFGIRATSHIMLALVSSFALSSCASMTSVRQSDKDNSAPDGLAYYLPLRHIKISIALDDKGKRTPTVTSGDAFPDKTSRYFIKFGGNVINTETLKVGVNDKGLLSSSETDHTSGVSQALQALASSAGGMSILSTKAPQAKECVAGQTYVALLDPSELSDKVAWGSLCGYSISGERLFNKPEKRDNALVQPSRAGYYYRQQLPYKVTLTATDATGKGLQSTSFIAYSPSESAQYFLPAGRGVFAHMTSNFTFTDGVPSQYNRMSDGELAGLFKLPADVLGAYTKAVGEAFKSEHDKSASEAQALADREALIVAKVKAEACSAAVSTGDNAKIVAACGK